MKSVSDEKTGYGSVIFGAISHRLRQSLISNGISRQWAKGETVFSRGDDGDYIIVIENGIAEVSVTSLNGRKSVLNHMCAGEILGEVALLDGGTRSADVVAHSALTGIVVQQRQLQTHLNEHPEAAFELIDQLCEKVRNASDMFETYAMTSAAVRLARCLLNFDRKWGADSENGNRVINQNFSQSDLGEFSGLARENVNRYISAWSRDGLVSFEKGQITLHDLGQLQLIAEL